MSGWNASVQPHCQLYGPRNLCYRKHNSFLSLLVLAAKLSPWSISSLDDPSEACYFLCCLRSDVCALVVLRPGGLWQREIYGRGLCNSFCVCKQRSRIATAWSFLQVVCCMHAFLCVNATVCLLRVRNYHKCLWKCLTGSIDYVESQTPCFFPYFFWEVGKVL